MLCFLFGNDAVLFVLKLNNVLYNTYAQEGFLELRPNRIVSDLRLHKAILKLAPVL